jgi:HEAT repeat protein
MSRLRERNERRRRRRARALLALREGEAGTRREAAEALGRLRDARAISALIRALDDSEASVREQVARALGRIGGARALAPLCRTMADPEPSVSLAATVALCALVAHPDPAVSEARRDLIAGLGQEVVRPLLAALDHRPGNEWWIAEALGQLAQRCPAPELRKALPLLRQHLRDGPLAEAARFYRVAIDRIERATVATEDLPLPAPPPAVAAADLPIPSRATSHDDADLPLPAECPSSASDATVSEASRDRPWWRRIRKEPGG